MQKELSSSPNTTLLLEQSFGLEDVYQEKSRFVQEKGVARRVKLANEKGCLPWLEAVVAEHRASRTTTSQRGTSRSGDGTLARQVAEQKSDSISQSLQQGDLTDHHNLGYFQKQASRDCCAIVRKEDGARTEFRCILAP